MNDVTPKMTTAELNALHASGNSERSQQEALVRWARHAEAERSILRLPFHILNGGHRMARSGARLKRMHAKAGVRDLCLYGAARCSTDDAFGALLRAVDRDES